MFVQMDAIQKGHLELCLVKNEGDETVWKRQGDVINKKTTQ